MEKQRNGIGRRKAAVTRVFLSKGEGSITVNDKDYTRPHILAKDPMMGGGECGGEVLQSRGKTLEPASLLLDGRMFAHDAANLVTD